MQVEISKVLKTYLTLLRWSANSPAKIRPTKSASFKKSSSKRVILTNWKLTPCPWSSLEICSLKELLGMLVSSSTAKTKAWSISTSGFSQLFWTSNTWCLSVIILSLRNNLSFLWRVRSYQLSSPTLKKMKTETNSSLSNFAKRWLKERRNLFQL